MSWQQFLEHEQQQAYFQAVEGAVAQKRLEHTVYPAEKDVYNALKCTPYQSVKAVILGQDPYHGPDQAHGLSFSVPPGQKIPPSLRNIFKELNEDLQIPIPNHGNLSEWASRGVLLLNTTLTVTANLPLSHRDIGWERLTDNMIKYLNQHDKAIVFFLWGAHARSRGHHITNKQHLILEASHPSPLAAYRGFFGCRHFSQCNNWLIEHGRLPVDWAISDITG